MKGQGGESYGLRVEDKGTDHQVSRTSNVGQLVIRLNEAVGFYSQTEDTLTDRTARTTDELSLLSV